MERRYFNNYKTFTCIADACPTNCCSGWIIDIDEDSLKKYSEYRGHDYELLQERVDFKNSVTKRKPNGDCAFLREDGLCQMQRSLGEEFLCETCDMFPRHIEEFPGIREYTLSTACPVVAMDMVTKSQPHQWSIEKDDEADNEDYDDFSNLLYEKLQVIRDALISLLSDRSIPFDVRAMLSLDMIAEVQEKIDEGDWEGCDSNLSYYHTKEAIMEAATAVSEDTDEEDRYHDEYRLLYNLKPMNETFTQWIKTSEATLFNDNDFIGLLVAFEEATPDLDIMREQVSTYFINTYFCGAVYDNYVYSLAALAIYNAHILTLLWMAKWSQQERTLSKEITAEILYRYSREIENEYENLKTLEELLDLA